MENEHFNLSHNNFHVSAARTFKSLVDDEHFIDVTLACDDGRQISAHKVILSTNSSFFQDILTKNNHQHPLIYLFGVNFSDLQSIVRFMYLGEVNIQENNLQSFLSLSEKLNIEGLSNFCKMLKTVTKENVGDKSESPTQQRIPLDAKEDDHAMVEHENISSENFEKRQIDIFHKYRQINAHQNLQAVKVEKGKNHKNVAIFRCDQCDFISYRQRTLYLHKEKDHETRGTMENKEKHKIVKFKIQGSLRDFKLIPLRVASKNDVQGMQAENGIALLISGEGMKSLVRGHFDSSSWMKGSTGQGKKSRIYSNSCVRYNITGCPATKRKWVCIGVCEFRDNFCCEHFAEEELLVVLFAFKHNHEHAEDKKVVGLVEIAGEAVIGSIDIDLPSEDFSAN